MRCLFQLFSPLTQVFLIFIMLLPTRSEERGMLGVGSIPVSIIPSFQDMKTIALYLHKHEFRWVW